MAVRRAVHDFAQLRERQQAIEALQARVRELETRILESESRSEHRLPS